jgi:hypothetical protein
MLSYSRLIPHSPGPRVSPRYARVSARHELLRRRLIREMLQLSPQSFRESPRMGSAVPLAAFAAEIGVTGIFSCTAAGHSPSHGET